MEKIFKCLRLERSMGSGFSRQEERAENPQAEALPGKREVLTHGITLGKVLSIDRM